MLEEFAPLLVLLLFSLIFSRFTKAVGKANARRAPQKPKAQAPQPAQAMAPAAETELPPQREEPHTLTPTVSYDRNDSLYQGSLNAVTGEGYDPCHNEQLAPLTAAETAVPAADTAVPGLQLSWTGSDIVRGFVMSEILTRKQ